MTEKSDKKTIIILLAILAISVIGGGVWTYNSLKPLDDPQTYLSDSPLSITEVFAIKEEAIQNVQDFLVEPGSKSTNIWDNFYSDEQVKRLRDTDTSIDIDEYSNNPNPFVIPIDKSQDKRQ